MGIDSAEPVGHEVDLRAPSGAEPKQTDGARLDEIVPPDELSILEESITTGIGRTGVISALIRPPERRHVRGGLVMSLRRHERTT